MRQQVKSSLESSKKIIKDANIQQNNHRKKYWQTIHDGFCSSIMYLPNHWSTFTGCHLMENPMTESLRVEEGKVIAERLNGFAASIGCIALVGAYLTTGQIVPGII